MLENPDGDLSWNKKSVKTLGRTGLQIGDKENDFKIDIQQAL